MKKILLLAILLIVSTNVFSQTKWEDRYDKIKVISGTEKSDYDNDIGYYTTNKGYAVVLNNDKYGIADLQNQKEIVSPVYDSIALGGKYDLIRVLSGDKWGVINFKTGDIIVPVKYSRIGDLDTGKPMIVSLDGKYGLVSHSGTVILEPTYGLIMAHGAFELNGKYGLLDWDGRILAEPIYAFIAPGLVFFLDGKMGYLNRDGSVALPNIYDQASAFENGRATVVIDGKTMVIGSDGKEFTGKFGLIDKEEIKVGQKPVDTVVETVFRFRNDSNKNVVITRCAGTHPQTVATASLKVVKPGETVEVNVKFPAYIGPFAKTAIVMIDTGEKFTVKVLGEGMP